MFSSLKISKAPICFRLVIPYHFAAQLLGILFFLARALIRSQKKPVGWASVIFSVLPVP